MTNYFQNQFIIEAKKQKNRCLYFYLSVLAVYLAIITVLLVKCTQLPYIHYGNTQQKVTILKAIHYSLTTLMVVFSALYLGIKYKRIKKYYIRCRNMSVGIKEKFVGSFLEYSEDIIDKDGVDFKSLIFIEWNKYKKVYYERKVFVFYEKPFPEFKENDYVEYVTHGNVLYSYKILERDN